MMLFDKAAYGARYRWVVTATVVLCIAAALLTVRGSEAQNTKTASQPDVIFSTPLQESPGKNLVVVRLEFAPARQHVPVDHRHPGSVYVYVTRGTVRFGIEGEPVRELHAGDSFFEPPGALHTVAESASTTESAEALAVMIVPDGAPLVIRDSKSR